MAIRFISGKPGGGKSYYATVLVLERLRETKKQIVTNLPLDVAEICAYLHKEYGETYNAHERIRLLDAAEEVGKFWMYFGVGLELDVSKRIPIRMSDGRMVSHLDYTPRYDFSNAHEDNSGSVCYFIDEAHEYFNAREWKDCAKDCLHYLSQHRKLGDEVTFITQHVRNVDTQLRRLCFEFCYARNHMKEKLPGVGGLFRSIQRLGVSVYGEEEHKGAVQVDHRFLAPRWDTIGKCYDTAAGVGIGGRKADIGERAKGLPMWTILLAILVVGLFLHYFTSPSFWGHFIKGKSAPSVVTQAVASSMPGTMSHNLVMTNASVPKVLPEAKVAGRVAKSHVRLCGISAASGEMVGYFEENGSNRFAIYFANDPSFEGFVRSGRRLLGVKMSGRQWLVGESKTFERKE